MKLKGRYSVWGWVWRIGLTLVLLPLVLLAILSVLLYIPPVQKWAVDTASDVLSDEMQMEVSIEKVRLKCPLDLCLNGMLAVQEGDTVLDAEELALSVRFIPLLSGNVEVDDVHLTNTKLNTRELIEACRIKGKVGKLSLVSHSTSLTDELAVVNRALLKDADVSISMADSIPEDTTTTESEPVNWQIDLRDVQFDNVRVAFDMPMDTTRMSVYAHIGKAKLHGLVDLGHELYRIDELDISGSELGYEGMVRAEDVVIDVDSFSYRGTGDMSLIVNQLAAKVYPMMEGVNEG